MNVHHAVESLKRGGYIVTKQRNGWHVERGPLDWWINTDDELIAFAQERGY